MKNSKRVMRNLLLAIVAVALGLLVIAYLRPKNIVFALSMATAYVGMIFIAATLVLGPTRIIRGRPNPVSSFLRRDIAIWAGVISIAHVIFGLQRHFGGNIWLYFFKEADGGLIPRIDAMGLTNDVGLIATVICLLLLAISNNASVRSLGTVKWKRIQRYNYLLFGFVVFHGFLYQFIVNRPMPWVAAIAVTTFVVVGIQLKGYLLVRRQKGTQ